MLATVLMIAFDGEELIMIQDNDDSARAALIRFVDERWTRSFGDMPLPLDDDERVRRFFVGENDSYVIAEADLSNAAKAWERLVAQRPEDPR